MSLRSPRAARRREGEVSSGDEEKAISTSTNINQGSKVDRSVRIEDDTSSRSRRQIRDISRSRSRSRSPYRKSRSRSRSPYRAGKPVRGEKRRHEEDHYTAKGGSDPRKFKVHYENGGSKRGIGYRPNSSHGDPVGTPSFASHAPHDDRAGRGYKPHARIPDRARSRDRSRSPYRHGRADERLVSRDKTNIPGSRHAGSRQAGDSQQSSNPSAHDVSSSANDRTDRNIGTARKLTSQKHKSTVYGIEGDSTVGEEAASVAEKPKLSEAELIEQRRKRREAIKAKHKSQPTLLVKALEQNTISAPPTPAHDSSGGPSEQQSPPSSADSPFTTWHDSPPPGSPGSPAAFAVTNDEELADRSRADLSIGDDEGPSAADYDPNMDMEEDRPDHKRSDVQGADDGAQPSAQQAQGPASKQSKDLDMFADDDDDDMFAPEDAKPKTSTITKQARALDESLLDNWDYPDGHYRIILGELLDGRYAVQQQIGKGTFATVVRAQDIKTGNIVAVKIACNNDTMYKAGTREMDFLQLLNQQDVEDKKHIIRMLRRFDHKGHMCLVFENLSADLREVLKKFGRNVGLNLKAIRSYGQQMFLALSHLKKCQILHADLKPDNILVSEKRSLLKVRDLGTAAFAHDAEITPYLVSRFYRAPEVILGMPFDYAIDMWSIGCTLFELYTGRILFAGGDNNQMLRSIQDCRGRIPNRMLKRAELVDKHFTFEGVFVSQERDKMSGKTIMRQLNFIKPAPGKDLKSRLSFNSKGMALPELKELNAFIDLMEKCLQLDPAKRISPNEALRHSFIQHIMQSQPSSTATKITPAMNVPWAR